MPSIRQTLTAILYRTNEVKLDQGSERFTLVSIPTIEQLNNDHNSITTF